jgi:hypothetical protein
VDADGVSSAEKPSVNPPTETVNKARRHKGSASSKSDGGLEFLSVHAEIFQLNHPKQAITITQI